MNSRRGEDLVGGQDGIVRVGGEERGELAVGTGRGDVGPAAQGEREGLGERQLVRSTRPGREVGVVEDQVVGVGGLQADAEVGGVAVEKAEDVSTQVPGVGMEAGLAQEGVAAGELCGISLCKPAARQRGHVDGNVGLVDEFIVAAGVPRSGFGAVVWSAAPVWRQPGRLSTVTGLAARVRRRRCSSQSTSVTSSLPLERSRWTAATGRARRTRERDDQADPECTAGAAGAAQPRLLIGEERGEAGHGESWNPGGTAPPTPGRRRRRCLVGGAAEDDGRGPGRAGHGVRRGGRRGWAMLCRGGRWCRCRAGAGRGGGTGRVEVGEDALVGHGVGGLGQLGRVVDPVVEGQLDVEVADRARRRSPPRAVSANQGAAGVTHGVCAASERARRAGLSGRSRCRWRAPGALPLRLSWHGSHAGAAATRSALATARAQRLSLAQRIDTGPP